MTPDQLSARYPQYQWLVSKQLVGWTPFTQLSPWYLLPEGQIFRADERWPKHSEDRPLIVFARRDDNDDCACICPFDGDAYQVVLIEGWTAGGRGYEVITQYQSLASWYQTALNDPAGP